jgi:hypothetical protein
MLDNFIINQCRYFLEIGNEHMDAPRHFQMEIEV